jgi:Ca2+-binding RTX toxin-like protein
MLSVNAATYFNPMELADSQLSIGKAVGASVPGVADAIFAKLQSLAAQAGFHGLTNGVLGGLLNPLFDGSFFGSLGKPPSSFEYEPLVINLNGTGLAATTSISLGTQFDLQNNGFQQLTAWAGPGSGILAFDPTGGAITNGSQLFGTSYSLSGGGYAVDGFAALADLDSNSDGVINSSDTDWSDLRIWVDSTDNGTTDSGELETMSAAGIASISLTTTATDVTDSNGNYHGKTASYSLTGGGTGEIDDVSFQTDPTLTTPDATVTVNGTISLLPDASGYGTVASLHQAMQIQVNASSTTLETYVQDFVAATDDGTRNTLVDEIIFQWTGVEGVSPTARGSYFDARQLEALEQFSGQSFIDPYNSTSDPGSQSVAALTASYQQLHDYVLAELESQTDLQSLFTDMQAGYDGTTGAFYWNFSSAETEILSDLSADRANGVTTLSDFNQALHDLGLDQGEGYATFRSDLVSLGSDVAATFLYGTPVVNGTAGNDVITAWAGNQTVIAGQGGNDTLIGSGDNETFYGSGGSNLFIGGAGNNEVFWGGDNATPSWGGVSGASDTFIAGQGTETFHENYYGSATFYYAKGDGNLTISNIGDLNHHNVLVLDPSISRSDISLSSSEILTDGTSGDQITLDRTTDTLEFSDGTTINLIDTGGIQAATSGATLTGNGLQDIYSYDPGTGHVTLVDSGGANELWLGGTLTAGDLSLATSGNDLLITDGVSGDQITDINYGVQTIRFSDGSTESVFTAGNTYTLSGGTTSTGSGLNDTYDFASGTGTATISDPGGQNTLSFGSGISAASLTFTGSGNDLLITDGVSGDKVVIPGQLSAPVIQTIKFSGGSTMDLTAGLTLHEASGHSLLNGTGGNDTLLGNSSSQTLNGNGGNDVFVNGSGNTTANGGTGDDTYSYTSGSGDLTIVDAGGGNTIVLGSGITTGDVSLTASGNDLLITDGVGGDQITIKNQLGPQVVVGSLVFSDSTTESLENIALTMPSGAHTLNSTPGNDTLTATSGTETLVGNGGNDTFVGASGTDTMTDSAYGGNGTFVVGSGVTTVYGGAGNDTYSYASGDGALTINEGGGQNTIVLASGLTAGSLTFTASGHDLLITDTVSGDTLTLINQLENIEGVQTIEFSDSSTKSLEGIALSMPSGAYTLYGTSGSDTLTATSGTETLNGNGGNDIFIDAGGNLSAIGGTGNDTYSYASGSGLLTIEDNAGTNTLKLGSGITTGDVSLAVSGTDLLITDGVSGDTITLQNQLTTDLGITDLVFYGGTTEVLEGLALAMPSGIYTLNGTPGSDTLTATSGTETIHGNGGNDIFAAAGGNLTAIGASGNDTYSYASGDGNETIFEYGGTNTIKLGSGLTASNVSLSEDSLGADLVILDGTGGDQIDIYRAITGGTNEVQTLVYGDATTLDLTSALKLTAASGDSVLNGTAGNDTLIASSGNQTLLGDGGNDTYIAGSGTLAIYAGTGNDTYSYAAGDGQMTIYEYGGSNTLKLGSGLTASNVSLSESSTGYDLVILDGTGGDQIEISSALYLPPTYEVETLIYGDATTLDLSGGLTVTAASGSSTLNGTSSNDTLIGSSGTQMINGNGGNDVFIMGSGTESVTGGTGNDTYSYSSGDGHLTIFEDGGTNTLKLGSGLTASNVSLSEDTSGQDLLILDGTGGDQIDINGAMATGSSTIVQTLVYGDATTLDLTGGLKLTAASGDSVLHGSSSNDTLIGSSGTQTLHGNGGNDVFVMGSGTELAFGGSGNDTYSYSSGDGQMTIIDSGGTDTLKLGSGLTAANVSLSEDMYGNDLLVLDGTGGDEVDISGFASHLVHTLVYGDASTLNLSSGITVTAASGDSALNGTSGNDTLIATSGNQVVTGNGGNDTFIAGSGTLAIYAGTGNDTYSYASGDGQLNINETGGTNTLVLGSGLTAANVFLSESGSGYDLLMTDGVSGDEIDVNSGLYMPTYDLQTLVFGDSTTLDLGTVVAAASGDSTLNGTAGNDVILPNSSNMTLAGSGGDDTYEFGSGMGHDYINNGVSTTNSANGTLFFGHGIADDQLWFDRVDGSGNISGSGDNLRIDIMGTTTSMTINGWYIGGSSTYEKLSEFQVSDSGLKLDSQLANLVSAMSTFEANYLTAHGTAFDPTAVSSISDTTVLAAVSSDWHS